MSIETTLKKIGLNEKEIKIYLSLLKKGSATPAEIAKTTKVNRATVYNIAKELISKGIISEDISGKSTHFIALSPKNLNNLIEKTKRELEEKQELVKTALEELSMIMSDDKYPVPKIRFVEQDNLENFLFENFEKWNKEAQRVDGIWWASQDPTWADSYPEWIKWTWKQKVLYKFQSISNFTEFEEHFKDKMPGTRREIRYLKDTNFTSSIWVAGDYLVLISTRNNPHYLYEIHDSVLSANMREILKKMWSLTEK